MTGLLRLFRECVKHMVYNGAPGPASRHAAVGSKLPNELLPPSTVARNLAANLAVITDNAGDVSKDNPTALANTVIYLRALQSVNKLLQEHVSKTASTPLHDVQKAAHLVGLRLPSADNLRAGENTRTGCFTHRTAIT